MVLYTAFGVTCVCFYALICGLGGLFCWNLDVLSGSSVCCLFGFVLCDLFYFGFVLVCFDYVGVIVCCLWLICLIRLRAYLMVYS